MSWRDWGVIAVIGGLRTTAVMGLLFWAMQSISAGQAARYETLKKCSPRDSGSVFALLTLITPALLGSAPLNGRISCAARGKANNPGTACQVRA